MSSATVKTHLRHIYEKCYTHSRADILDLLETATWTTPLRRGTQRHAAVKAEGARRGAKRTQLPLRRALRKRSVPANGMPIKFSKRISRFALGSSTSFKQI